MSKDVKPHHRSVPHKKKITPVSGYPTKLVIFKPPASKFWWCRYFTQKKVLKRSTKTEDKSTKTEDKREALQFAKKILRRNPVVRAKPFAAEQKRIL